MRSNDKLILSALSSDPVSASDLAKQVGMHPNAAHKAMHRLCSSGHAVRVAGTAYPALYIAGSPEPDDDYVPMTTVARALLARPALATVWATQ